MSFIDLAPSLSGAIPIIPNLYLGQVAPLNTIEVTFLRVALTGPRPVVI